jgi:hypothetical protein
MANPTATIRICLTFHSCTTPMERASHSRPCILIPRRLLHSFNNCCVNVKCSIGMLNPHTGACCHALLPTSTRIWALVAFSKVRFDMDKLDWLSHDWSLRYGLTNNSLPTASFAQSWYRSVGRTYLSPFGLHYPDTWLGFSVEYAKQFDTKLNSKFSPS